MNVKCGSFFKAGETNKEERLLLPFVNDNMYSKVGLNLRLIGCLID